MGIGDVIGLVVGIGPVVGIGLFGGTGLVVSLTYLSKFNGSLDPFRAEHQKHMSVKCIPPQTPLLYRKSGVCRGIYFFLIFAPKHRLWVLVRTASLKYVLYQTFSTENL